MTDDQDLFRRADSLINSEAAADRLAGRRRIYQRRSFVAAAVATPRTAPGDTTRTSRSDSDDVPVLTDVVLPILPVSPAPVDPAKAVDKELLAAALRVTLAADLAEAIAQQLANDLPEIVAATLSVAAEGLRQEVAATIDRVLRDFLAQRGQLRLPLAAATTGESRPGVVPGAVVRSATI